MKRRLLWIIEVFVWLLILFLVSSGIMFAKYNYKRNFDTYQIFLPDVDGLIVGSPVKLMGIQIGYVNQLNITGEDIYVNFIITDTDVKIPRGAKATVEFSGLGGSKSLELYPPSAVDKESSMFIVPQPPKRIHDSLGLLSDMFDKAIDIAYDLSHFMEKMGFLEGGKLKEKKGMQSAKRKVHSAKGKRGLSSQQNYSAIQPFSSSAKEQAPMDELLEKCNCWLEKAQQHHDKFNEKLRNKKDEKDGMNGKNESHGQN